MGRLRLLGFFEGLSLLILLFIAMPLKYWFGSPAMTQSVGQIHGILFLLFVANTIIVSVVYNWKFTQTTWKVLLACVVPFGTFYVDKKILSKEQPQGK